MSDLLNIHAGQPVARRPLMTRPYTEHARQQAIQLADNAEAILTPDHNFTQAHGLSLHRLSVAQHGVDAVQVYDTAADQCVLAVDGCGDVLLYRPGDWQVNLMAWALATRAPMPTGQERIQVELDLSVAWVAEAGEVEQTASLDARDLNALEELGCLTLRAMERQRAGVPPYSRDPKEGNGWTGNPEKMGTIYERKD